MTNMCASLMKNVWMNIFDEWTFLMNKCDRVNLTLNFERIGFRISQTRSIIKHSGASHRAFFASTFLITWEKGKVYISMDYGNKSFKNKIQMKKKRLWIRKNYSLLSWSRSWLSRPRVWLAGPNSELVMDWIFGRAHAILCPTMSVGPSVHHT